MKDNKQTIIAVGCTSCNENALCIVGYLLEPQDLLLKCSSCHSLITIPMGEDKLEQVQIKSIDKKNSYLG